MPRPAPVTMATLPSSEMVMASVDDAVRVIPARRVAEAFVTTLERSLDPELVPLAHEVPLALLHALLDLQRMSHHALQLRGLETEHLVRDPLVQLRDVQAV